MFRPRPRTFAPAVLALSLGLSACGANASTDQAGVAPDEGFSIGAESDSTGVADPVSSPEPNAESTPETPVTAEPHTTVAPDTTEVPAPEVTTPPVLSATDNPTLARAADATAEVESGRFAMEMRMQGETDGFEVDGAILIQIDAAADGDLSALVDMGGLFEAALASATPQEQAEMGPFVEAFAAPTEARMVDGVAYTRGGIAAAFLGIDADAWIISEDQGGLGGGLEGGGAEDFFATADGLLAQFRASDSEVVEVGQEEFDGDTVTHYRAEVDPNALGEVNVGTDNDFKVTGASSVPIDFWVDGEGFLRRFTMKIDGADLEDADGLEQIDVVGEWTDLNDDIQIEVPSGNVLTAEEAAEQSNGGLFGELLEEELFNEDALNGN